MLGISGLHIWNLLIILLIVVLLFGSDKLPKLVSELTHSFRNSRAAKTDESKIKPVEAQVSININNNGNQNPSDPQKI